MMHSDPAQPSVHAPTAHVPQVHAMPRPDRHEGLTAWSLMLGILLIWFGVLPALVS